jgi:histidinol dehydrogenase
MNFVKYPPLSEWEQIAKRPLQDINQLKQQLQPVLTDIKSRGDSAIRHYTAIFDKIDLSEIKISPQEIDEAEKALSSNLKNAILLAAENISKFHKSQQSTPERIETRPGVICWRKNVPIEKVGLYIPGGSAPLFSSILMLGIPAKIAGCPEIILCTPPQPDGSVHPAVLFSAKLVGVSSLFKVGGAQAIAAMAYGTESIPKVDKILGPGNQYVTAAKQMVSMEGVAIDLPAGPSELLIIADENANPDYIAADLLSQAEHGPDSQVVLATTSDDLIQKVKLSTAKQLDNLPRSDIAKAALENSLLILLQRLEECINFSNYYAPEHLIIMTENYGELAEQVINAGSVFLGSYTPESAGDYASGTNHTLPTGAYARSYSGVSLDSYVKKITFQELTTEGLLEIGSAIEVMAEEEQLVGHQKAVSIRLDNVRKTN